MKWFVLMISMMLSTPGLAVEKVVGAVGYTPGSFVCDHAEARKPASRLGKTEDKKSSSKKTQSDSAED